MSTELSALDCDCAFGSEDDRGESVLDLSMFDCRAIGDRTVLKENILLICGASFLDDVLIRLSWVSRMGAGGASKRAPRRGIVTIYTNAFSSKCNGFDMQSNGCVRF